MTAKRLFLGMRANVTMEMVCFPEFTWAIGTLLALPCTCRLFRLRQHMRVLPKLHPDCEPSRSVVFATSRSHSSKRTLVIRSKPYYRCTGAPTLMRRRLNWDVSGGIIEAVDEIEEAWLEKRASEMAMSLSSGCTTGIYRVLRACK